MAVYSYGDVKMEDLVGECRESFSKIPEYVKYSDVLFNKGIDFSVTFMIPIFHGEILGIMFVCYINELIPKFVIIPCSSDPEENKIVANKLTNRARTYSSYYTNGGCRRTGFISIPTVFPCLEADAVVSFDSLLEEECYQMMTVPSVRLMKHYSFIIKGEGDSKFNSGTAADYFVMENGLISEPAYGGTKFCYKEKTKSWLIMMLEWLSLINCKKIFLYYTGCDASTDKNGLPLIRLSEERISITDLLTEIKEKFNFDLFILAVDSSNSEQIINEEDVIWTPKSIRQETNFYPENFWNGNGYWVLCAAEKGTKTYGSESGGVFTKCLINCIYNHKYNDLPELLHVVVHNLSSVVFTCRSNDDHNILEVSTKPFYIKLY